MPQHRAVTPPTLVSILICDQVIDDKLTNKKSAIGLFNMVIVSEFPARIAQLNVLASLTEITGRTPLELRLVRDADNHVLFGTKGQVEAPNPLVTVDLLFNLQGIQIPAAGQYAFELVCEGDVLGRRRFQVLPRPQRPATEPAPPGEG